MDNSTWPHNIAYSIVYEVYDVSWEHEDKPLDFWGTLCSDKPKCSQNTLRLDSDPADLTFRGSWALWHHGV